MIGLSSEELDAIIAEIQEEDRAKFAAPATPRDKAAGAVIEFQTRTLSRVAQLIAQNNRRLYEDLIALGVLGKDNEP